jgi:hypothetical protein
MKKKDKQRRREFFNAHNGLSHGPGELGVGLLEYLIEDDCSIPRLRTKREKKNFKVARKNVQLNKSDAERLTK